MTRREVGFFSLCLILMGAGWGATQPMTKVAVSTGYGHFGLIFWQVVIGALLMAVICALRGEALPLQSRALRLYLFIAMIGTVVPNTISYQAAVHLPAGVMSLLLSVIPMFAFVIALLMRNEHFAWRRLVGLVFGLMGVLIVVIPSVDLGLPIPAGWAAFYLLTALCYAFEGNYVAKWRTQGLGPFQVMLGASLMSLIVVTPLMLAQGHYIAPDLALPLPQVSLVASSIIHVLVYATYVWLVGRAGAVFAVQVSYMVTGFGLLWAWALLGEGYAASLWLALVAIFLGMYLVQPKAKEGGQPPLGKNAEVPRDIFGQKK